MKRTALALTLIVALLFSEVAQTLFATLARANPYPTREVLPKAPETSKPSVTLLLQKSGPTYNVRNVSYSFTILKPSSWTYHYLLSAQYVLDGERPVLIARQDTIETQSNYENAGYHVPGNLGDQPLSLKGSINGVSDGSHTVFFTITCVSYYYPPEWRPIMSWWKMPPEEYQYDVASSTVQFTVDATPPDVSILSLENKSYTVRDIPITQAEPEPKQPEPIPVMIMAGVSASIAFVGAGIAFYLRKRNR